MTSPFAPTRETFMDNPRPGGDMKTGDASAPSKSQLMPLGSGFQELVTKPYFVPAVVACLGFTLMWVTLSDRSMRWTIKLGGLLPVAVPMYYIVIALLLSAAGAFAIYRMAGKPKAWWLMPAIASAAAMLTIGPVMNMLQQLFSAVGPGEARGGVVYQFVHMFFAAGLPEESLKAIPVAIGVYIGLKLMGRLNATHPARQFAVLEPLDGVIIGAASGIGFAFAETVGSYMPAVMSLKPGVMIELAQILQKLNVPFKLPDPRSLQTMWDLLPPIAGLYIKLADAVGPARAAFEFNRMISGLQGAGLELMIPRLVGNVFGHAAYAGIFGYFIGLAMMKPANRVKTVLTGLVIACALHAAWNSIGGASAFFQFLIALGSFVFLAVSIIKARQMSPERSQLVASQIIDHAARPAAYPTMPSAMPAAMPAAMRAPAAPAAPAAPMAAPGSITWDDDSNQRVLEIGSARVPAAVGARLWERQAPGATASRGDGVVAEVSANPNDAQVLGLKNLSLQTWSVTLAGGAQRELAPGRSIRLEAGMQLKIGDLTANVR